ncbi:hypothetical protein V6N11_068031 [Hibiscus sabdariffa]|uniref:Uncharacterized protein n=1 Tax=Hibiscus sabdariffa TaxID=183260 RepID=A0ABR2ST91_9ROSI
MGRSSWMAEENIDMKQGVENTCVGIRDLTKYELDVDGIDDPGQANVMDGPVVAGILNDNERAKLAESVEYKGQQRKVRLWVHVDWSGGIMGIYAACGGAEQPAFCEKALMIISRTRCAWCVGGHFNAVLRSDKCRGCVLSTQVINVFNEFVEEAALVDIPL